MSQENQSVEQPVTHPDPSTSSALPSPAEKPKSDFIQQKESERKEVLILKRLATSLEFAIEASASKEQFEYYFVFVPTEGAASFHSFPTFKEFSTGVLSHRGKDGNIYMFKGQQLILSKGDPWAVVDNGTLRTLTTDTLPTGLDPSGDMRTPPDLDNIVLSGDAAPSEEAAEPLAPPATPPNLQPLAYDWDDDDALLDE